MPPLRLSDSELDAIHRAAWPLAPHDRGPFLEAVAAKLSERPELLGDSHIARVCIECQRKFWTPPLDERRARAPSKWARARRRAHIPPSSAYCSARPASNSDRYL